MILNQFLANILKRRTRDVKNEFVQDTKGSIEEDDILDGIAYSDIDKFILNW